MIKIQSRKRRCGWALWWDVVSIAPTEMGALSKDKAMRKFILANIWRENISGRRDSWDKRHWIGECQAFLGGRRRLVLLQQHSEAGAG